MSYANNWFEIPALDLDRAVRFYEQVLGLAVERETLGGSAMAVFPADKEGVRGALVQDRRPSGDGVLVYLNAGGEFDAIVGRLEGAGGSVILPKTGVSDQGFIAIFRDTEGNVVGLQAPR